MMREPRFLSEHPDLAPAAAALLARQWPETAASSRLGALRAHCHHTTRHGQFPCHLLLVETDGPEGGESRVIAHCRLQAACEHADGFSAAVTSVVVDPALRGLGVGRQLMRAAEHVAAQLGYGYMYLWTHNAMCFYAKLGYAECDAVSLLRPVLATLDQTALSKLENLMAARAGKAAAAGGVHACGSESLARLDSTWMRRRLRELGRSEPITHDALLAALNPQLSQRGVLESRLTLRHSIHWERQIGPCCGLAALRMARTALRPAPSSPSSSPPAQSLPLSPHWPAINSATIELHLRAQPNLPLDASVLAAAVERGYSSDGEVFDIHHLAYLAADVCGLHATVLVSRYTNHAHGSDAGCACDAQASHAPGSDLFSEALASWLHDGGLAIVPYDAGSAHEPAMRGGHAAHYALLVATVTSQADEACEMLWVGVHGLSRLPLAASSGQLAASNAQLKAMKGGVAAAGWKTGEEGIRLAGRVLLVAPPS